MENPTVEQIVGSWTYQQQKSNQVMLNLIDALLQQNKQLQEALALKEVELAKCCKVKSK